MTVAIEDRSTVEDLKTAVLAYIQETVWTKQDEDDTAAAVKEEEEEEALVANATGSKRRRRPERRKQPNVRSRPFYIAGESFGGILACDVALELLQDKSLSFEGLTLINPATCYYRSRLAIDGPVVADSHPWFYYFNLVRLLPLFTDEYSFDQLLMILRGEALPSVIDDALRESYLGRVAFSLPFVIPVMKQGTLRWRLSEWLEKGSARMDEGKLAELADDKSLRILLVVGENDGTLPSIDEAERLAGIFGPKQLDVHVVEGAGHASTCGSRVDLAALFRQTFPALLQQSRQKQNEERTGLRWGRWRRNAAGAEEIKEPRTKMKPIAAKGEGKYLGMEPRYDNATIGLSPLKYWDSKYYQTVNTKQVKANGEAPAKPE